MNRDRRTPKPTRQGLRPPGNLGTLPPPASGPAPRLPAGLLAGVVLVVAVLGGVVLFLAQ